MKPFLLLTIVNCLIAPAINCQISSQPNSTVAKPTQISETALPKGFERVIVNNNSYEYWLQHFPLQPNNKVYLYDGSLKSNQLLHAAVLDISVGTKNLQQCADAVVRLKAEYHFARKEYNKIVFKVGKIMFNFNIFASIKNCFNHDCLLEFLEHVFINYGTYNLEEQLKPVINYTNLTIGNVFIKGGSPGHTMLVVDVAINKATGEKIFLLAQSFMPAQSVHIVKNLNSAILSPWYSTKDLEIKTPEWSFTQAQLKKW